MNIPEFDLEMARADTEEARDQRDEAVAALLEIYRIRGEDPDIAAIATAVLDRGWAELSG